MCLIFWGFVTWVSKCHISHSRFICVRFRFVCGYSILRFFEHVFVHHQTQPELWQCYAQLSPHGALTWYFPMSALVSCDICILQLSTVSILLSLCTQSSLHVWMNMWIIHGRVRCCQGKEEENSNSEAGVDEEKRPEETAQDEKSELWDGSQSKGIVGRVSSVCVKCSLWYCYTFLPPVARETGNPIDTTPQVARTQRMQTASPMSMLLAGIVCLPA